jgi:hypothetical protein
LKIKYLRIYVKNFFKLIAGTHAMGLASKGQWAFMGTASQAIGNNRVETV